MTAALSMGDVGRDSKPSSRLSAIIPWLALLSVGYLPLLLRFSLEQWGRPQYQFFPLIIVAALYIGYQRIHELYQQPRPGDRRIGLALLLMAGALLVAASVLWSGRIAATSLWLALVGIVWRIGGLYLLRALAPSALLLALAIGVPLGLDDVLLQRLRELAVYSSSELLNWLRLPHLVSGTVLEIPGHRLLVAEACSGINSMMAVMGFTLVLSFLRQRPWNVTALLLVFGTLFVLWSNTVRIAGGAYLKAQHDIDILSGAAHEWASVVLFCVSMLLVISCDELINLIREWMERRRIQNLIMSGEVIEETPEPVAVPPSVIEVQRPSRGMWILASFFALIGVGQVANASLNGGVAWWIWGSSVSHLPAAAVFSMPHELAGWTRLEDAEKFIAQPEIEGKSSQSWLYEKGDLKVILAVDFPFPGYHDLTLCYRNAGWTVADLRHLESEQAETYSRVELSRLSEHGFLCFSLINELNEWVEPPAKSTAGKLMKRVRHMGKPDWSAPSYQIQVWAQSFEPLSEQQKQDVRDLFLSARPIFARQFMEQLGGAR